MRIKQLFICELDCHIQDPHWVCKFATVFSPAGEVTYCLSTHSRCIGRCKFGQQVEEPLDCKQPNEWRQWQPAPLWTRAQHFTVSRLIPWRLEVFSVKEVGEILWPELEHLPLQGNYGLVLRTVGTEAPVQTESSVSSQSGPHYTNDVAWKPQAAKNVCVLMEGESTCVAL